MTLTARDHAVLRTADDCRRAIYDDGRRVPAQVEGVTLRLILRAAVMITAMAPR